MLTHPTSMAIILVYPDALLGTHAKPAGPAGPPHQWYGAAPRAHADLYLKFPGSGLRQESAGGGAHRRRARRSHAQARGEDLRLTVADVRRAPSLNFPAQSVGQEAAGRREVDERRGGFFRGQNSQMYTDVLPRSLVDPFDVYCALCHSRAPAFLCRFAADDPLVSTVIARHSLWTLREGLHKFL